MQSGAVPLIAFQLTGSATWVGLAALAAFLPSMFATIPGGLIADRFSRRRHLLVNQLLLAIITFALAAVSALGLLDRMVLLAFLALQSVLLGLSVPSWQAYVPTLVAPHRMKSAINLNSAQAQLARAVGPAVAGIMLAHFGATWAFLANAISYAIAVLVLIGLSRDAKPRYTDTYSPMDQLRTGWQFAWQNAGVRTAVVVVAVCMALGGPVYQLVSVFSADALHVGPAQYGILLGAFGVGALVGNSSISVFSGARRSTFLVLAVCTYGSATVATALTTSITQAVIAMAALGAAYVAVTITLLTSVQVLTPEHVKGRVLAIYSFAYIGGTPIGSVILGATADLLGVRSTLVLSGLSLIAVGVVLASKAHARTSLDGEREQDDVVIDLAALERDRERVPS